MTSDATRSEREQLRDLVGRARVVLWGFDGTVCRLFAGRSAEQAAVRLGTWLEAQGLPGLATDDRGMLRPDLVLDALGAHRAPSSDLVAELEERLTEEEFRAVGTAMPIAHSDPLIRTWVAIGARMAITSNNSAKVMRAYLEGRGLLGCFAPHIYGRPHDFRLVDPHVVSRVLNALGAAPSDALVIGGSRWHLLAAQKARVPSLGYANREDRAELLRQAGAEIVVNSLEPVRAALLA